MTNLLIMKLQLEFVISLILSEVLETTTMILVLTDNFSKTQVVVLPKNNMSHDP